MSVPLAVPLVVPKVEPMLDPIEPHNTDRMKIRFRCRPRIVDTLLLPSY